MPMKRLSWGILAAVQLAGTWVTVAQAGTAEPAPGIPTKVSQAKRDGSSPAITISAHNLDFGAVPVGSNYELTFKIENVGDGILSGTADVSTPFSIVAGSSFVLKPAQTQLITIQYAPKSTGMHMTVVHLNGASITVMGRTGPRAPKAPNRRIRAPQPEGPRLLAQR